MDLTSHSPEELALLIPNLSTEELQTLAPKLSGDHIKLIVSALDKKKALVLVKEVSDLKLLEVVGEEIDLTQATHILRDYLNWSNGERLKLPPLLVGMPQGLFIELLLQGDETVLFVLKEASITEPIQHHLHTLIRDMEKDNLKLYDALSWVEGRIDNLNIQLSSKEELREIHHDIETIEKNLNSSLKLLNQALGIAWNTGRLDLIERLNTLNINIQRIKMDSIGSPRTNVGLYERLEQMLHNVFGNPLDIKDEEPLNDNDPAVEGLVKFSVWYLQDYWEVGLLPQYPNLMDVTLADRHVSDHDFHEHRLKVFKYVQENLAKIGLNTVKDLKRADIFSKKTLEEYIQTHKHLLV